MGHKVTIVYKTENGTTFDSYTKALIADFLEKLPQIYLKEYQVNDIATSMAESFNITSKEAPEVVERIEDETLRPS